MELASFEREAEVFCQELSREYYRHGAGLKETLEIGRIYDRHGALFSLDRFHEFGDAEVEPKYRRFLRAFVADHYLESAVKELSERIAALEATLTVEWDGRTVSYRSAPVIWTNEPVTERRHALNALWRNATSQLNPLAAERLRLLHTRVLDLDLGDYVAAWDELRGLGLATLGEQMDRFLAETGEVYRAALDTELAPFGLRPDDAWKADLAHVLRAPRFDRWFGRDQLLAALHATLRDLGIDLESQPNVRLDVEARPLKSPRAFCAAIEIPDDVRLVLLPQGGQKDYATLLHEAGHAEHFAHIDRTLPFAYRRLGDHAVTEAYAFLLEYLVTDPIWLRRHLDFVDSADYLSFSALNRLYLLRRYATKLAYERELHRAERVEDQADRYAELFSQTLGVRYFPEDYLVDVDDGLYSAQYLRAWMLESQLRDYLKREYDEEWFRHPRAGRFLKERWREGQRYTADELARHLGYERLDARPLQEEIVAALRR